jgi:hypothetical protein
MELRNITPFKNFRKIFEEVNMPNEFSNNTGFRESLVGRALFGILRYFKKGIQLGKLEYYKRKLENEYFAAILRFCAYKGIDLKTGEDPNAGEGGAQGQEEGGEDGGGEQKNPAEKEFCEILSFDCWNDPNGNEISSRKKKFADYLNDLNRLKPTLTNPDDIAEADRLIDKSTKVISCCDKKIAINTVFSNLAHLSGSTDANVAAYLDQIKEFFNSPEAKMCSTYDGTENEKNLIKSFSTSTDTNIKSRSDQVIQLLGSAQSATQLPAPAPTQALPPSAQTKALPPSAQTKALPPSAPTKFLPEKPIAALPPHERFRYNEAIESGINKSVPITQMLGDQLNLEGKASSKVNIYEYLQKIGINSVDEINFVELVKLFRANPSYRDDKTGVSSENYLNYAGVRKIQYAVSDGIIFHVKKTPDNVGINPGEGGMTNFEEDTSLRKTWEKKVEFVKSEFNGFFNFEIVDPFRLLNLSDALREHKNSAYSGDRVVLDDRGVVENLGKTLELENKKALLGLKPRGNEVVATENTPLIFSVSHGANNYYPVFSLCGSSGTNPNKVYRYIGCINFNKIIDDKELDKPDYKNNAKNFANAVWDTTVKSGSDADFLNFLKIPQNSLNNGAEYFFDSIYFTASNYDAIKSNRDSSTNPKNMRILYNYVKKTASNGNNFTGVKATAVETDFALKYLTNGNVLEPLNIKNVKSQTTKTVKMYFGEIFELLPGWDRIYFPDMGTNQVSKYCNKTSIAYINQPPYEGKITLR